MPTRKKKTKTAAIYTADGCRYKNAAMLAVHNELKKNRHIKSFSLPQLDDGQKRGHYGSYKCMINNINFDSVMEGRFYAYLLDRKAARAIKAFSMQVPYELIPKFKTKTGKSIRSIDYVADFVITDTKNHKTVIDIKGKKTEVFKIKEKLFHYHYPNEDFVCVRWDSMSNEWRNLEDIEKDARARKRAKKKKTSAKATK